MIKKSFRLKDYKSLVAIFLTALLILFFYNKSIVDKEKYYININHLNKLKEINSTLYGNLFLTQFNQIKHYDILRGNIKSLYENSIILKQMNKDIKNSAFRYNLDKYFYNLELKEEYLNNLISHFAVYKNFIEFYPKLSNDMAEKFKVKYKNLSEKILVLQNKILIFNYNNKIYFKELLIEIEEEKDYWMKKIKKISLIY